MATLTKAEQKIRATLKNQLKGDEVYNLLTPKTYSTKIIDKCDLRLGHYMLARIAEHFQIDFSKLKMGSGQAVVFLNNAKTSLKMFFSPQTMIYYKSDQPIDKEVIHGMAKTIMSGGKGNWNKETEKVVTKLLAKENRLAEEEDLKRKLS